MEPLGLFTPQPVGAQVEEHENRDQLEGIDRKSGKHEPKVDTARGGQKKDGVSQKA